MSGPTDVFKIPDASNRQLIPDRVNATLHFTNNNWCVVTDGTGWLYLLKTGDRSQDHDWKVGCISVDNPTEFFNLEINL